MTLNMAKLRELIVYVTQRCESDPDFGKTKLYKTLFYADFSAFRQTGRPITGCDYKKLPHGPIPALGPEVIDELVREGAIAIASRIHFGYTQLQPRALREADLGEFTGTEIGIVNQVISDLWPLNARDVSDLSHRFLGWKAAEDYEVIPYETALLDTGPATPEEESWLEGLVAAGR